MKPILYTVGTGVIFTVILFAFSSVPRVFFNCWSTCCVWLILRWICSGCRCWLKAGPLRWMALWGRESICSVCILTVCWMVRCPSFQLKKEKWNWCCYSGERSLDGVKCPQNELLKNSSWLSVRQYTFLAKLTRYIYKWRSGHFYIPYMCTRKPILKHIFC